MNGPGHLAVLRGLQGHIPQYSAVPRVKLGSVPCNMYGLNPYLLSQLPFLSLATGEWQENMSLLEGHCDTSFCLANRDVNPTLRKVRWGL